MPLVDSPAAADMQCPEMAPKTYNMRGPHEITRDMHTFSAYNVFFRAVYIYCPFPTSGGRNGAPQTLHTLKLSKKITWRAWMTLWHPAN